ncbi:DUF308 domain-containing protein [Corynebacterium sp. YIM 101645]|uniref:DUF308 domain-containing protein n=1 Tax=Corynebacterium lemuris TaxID=1859292 RepID=A0ABT2FZU8_9CORY|nr:DUF308 domain-containing protein [Corynebacterium lemuris]
MTALQQRLPWWPGALLGVLSLVLGVILILRPYLSLAALLMVLAVSLLIHGVSLLLQRRWTGLLWLALGLAGLVVPGLSLAVLALLLGAVLIIEALTDGTRALRKRDWAELMSAATSLILGILALSWPDVTVIVVAVIFGVLLANFGLSRITAAIRRARNLPEQERDPRRSTLKAAVGLGTEGAHPYLIGQAEGRSVLDSIRAARQLHETDLSPTSVIWGHSQGGHAALWAGGLAGSYAPELAVAGVAAMSPAANLPALFDSLNDSAIGSLFGSFALAAYAAEYPEIHARDYVRPGARLMAEAMSRRCLSDPATIVSVATALVGREPIWAPDPLEGPLGERAAENVPTLLIDAPVLIAQGADDTLVTPAAQEDYVERRRAAGQEIDYRVFGDQDHLSVIADDSPMIPELREWTRERFLNR